MDIEDIQNLIQFLKQGSQALQIGQNLRIIDKSYLNQLCCISKNVLPFNTDLIDNYVMSGKHYIDTMNKMSYRMNKLERSNIDLLSSNSRQQQKFFTDTIDYLQKEEISEFKSSKKSSVIFENLNEQGNMCILSNMKQEQIEQTIVARKPLILIKRQVKKEMEEVLDRKLNFLDVETFLD
jgi:hypothetical protein